MLGESTATFSKFSDGDARFGIWRLKKEPKKFKVSDVHLRGVEVLFRKTKKGTEKLL